MKKRTSLVMVKRVGERLYYIFPPADMAYNRGYFYQQTKDIQKRYYNFAKIVLKTIEEGLNVQR
jgi:hypothetical protein